MLFTSYEFLAFLALTFIAYFLAPKRCQWAVLLVASYVFYFLAGAEYLVFIAATTVSSYFVARKMARITALASQYIDENKETMDKEARKAYRARAKKKSRGYLVAGLLFNFGILAVLKYTGFAIVNINAIFGLHLSLPELILPLGISFYTFRTMGYIIDVYRGKAEAQKNIFKLALFVSFFPQIVQGPISRYGELEGELFAPHRFSGKVFFSGMQRILWGYFKKLVVADRILVVMKELLGDTAKYDGAYVVLLIVLYSFEIYADFTGGIDITIGIAESMGIRIAENFRHPFTSKSTKEYWNRWHITMGSWFTDYIFYPLSVSKLMQGVSKKSRKLFGNALGKRVPVYSATIATWFLTGLWHGASWNFIVWGLLNCLVILVSQELEPLYKKFRARFPRLVETKIYGGFAVVRTFLLMGLIRSLDCYRNVPTTFRKWGTMFTVNNWGEFFSDGFKNIGLSGANLAIILSGILVVSIVNVISIKNEDKLREKISDKPWLSYTAFALVFVLVLTFGAYGIGYDASQFIYNQF